MINQQLLDYIKQQIQQGVSQEQIKNSLIANGWQQQDVEEGFNIIAQSASSSFSAVPTVASSGIWKIIAGIVIGAVILSGGAYFASQTIFKSKEAPKISNEVLNQPLVETSTNATSTQSSQQPESSQQSESQTQSQNPEIAFIDCGTISDFRNFDCFINAAKNCSPAKVIVYSQLDFFTMKNEVSTFYEIKGQQENKCVFYIKLISNNVTFNQELIQEMLGSGVTNEEIKQEEQEILKITQSMIGYDGTCKFTSANDLVNLLNKWKKDSFFTEDFNGIDCKGEYFGQGEQLANISKTMTYEECNAQEGIITSVNDNGTACFKNQIDLGTVVGSIKINGKYPQCCVYK